MRLLVSFPYLYHFMWRVSITITQQIARVTRLVSDLVATMCIIAICRMILPRLKKVHTIYETEPIHSIVCVLVGMHCELVS